MADLAEELRVVTAERDSLRRQLLELKIQLMNRTPLSADEHQRLTCQALSNLAKAVDAAFAELVDAAIR